jgi:hypothetical protein
MSSDAGNLPRSSCFDFEIFESVLTARSMTEHEARLVKSWQFTESQYARMHELAQKNRDDTLTPIEREELESFLRVGMFLNILHAQALCTLAESIRG